MREPRTTWRSACCEIIAALDREGRWVTRGHIQKRNWEFNDRIETEVCIRNTATLAAYLEVVK